MKPCAQANGDQVYICFYPDVVNGASHDSNRSNVIVGESFAVGDFCDATRLASAINQAINIAAGENA